MKKQKWSKEKITKFNVFLNLIKEVKNWHIPLFYYTNVQNGKKIIEFKNDIKFIIRDKSDSVAFFENFFLKVNFPTKKNEVNDDDVIIDVGAHIGCFTIDVAKKARKGKIIALEPTKKSYELLKENIKINNFQNIIADNLGIWKKTDIISLYTNENDSIGNNLFKKTNQIEEINVISLSECIEKYDIEKIDFLKMDCEGAEFEIILGLTDETLKKIKKMSIEVHMMRKEFAVEDLMKFLQQHDFTVNIKSTFYEMTSMLYAENKEFSI